MVIVEIVSNYIDAEKIVSTIGLKAAKKMTVNIKMEHKPGYIFDVTMTESNHKGTALLPSIDSARIEVYNNTNRNKWRFFIQKISYGNSFMTYE